MNTRGMNMDIIDDSGLHDVNDEDIESREKPKVTYICGGMYSSYYLHFLFIIISRLRQGQ
jgi:hypothetical protein